jgi:hypothetical protein
VTTSWTMQTSSSRGARSFRLALGERRCARCRPRRSTVAQPACRVARRMQDSTSHECDGPTDNGESGMTLLACRSTVDSTTCFHAVYPIQARKGRRGPFRCTLQYHVCALHAPASDSRIGPSDHSRAWYGS